MPSKRNKESITGSRSRQIGSGEDESSRKGADIANRESFDRLKSELCRAFSAPEEEYKALSVSDVIARNRE